MHMTVTLVRLADQRFFIVSRAFFPQVSAAQRFKAWSVSVSGQASGSAAGDLAGALFAQGTRVDCGPGAVAPPRPAGKPRGQLTAAH